MRFQHQQKGLFTFYKEQQLFEEETEKLKKMSQLERYEQAVNQQERNKKQRKSFKQQMIASIKLTSQPVIQHENSESAKDRVNFKQYGDAVMIGNRKQTQYVQNHSKRASSQNKYQQYGSYLENKNISFDTPFQEDKTVAKNKKQHRKRQILPKLRREDRASAKLPSISKIEQPEPFRSPPEPRHNLNGSLLRSNGSDLLRQIRSQAVEDHSSGLQKKSVSYFEFSRDYKSELQAKKRGALSLQQRKILEILGRYRRGDN